MAKLAVGSLIVAGICLGIIGLILILGAIAAVILVLIFNDNSNEVSPAAPVLIGNNITLEYHTASVIALAIIKNLMASASRNGEIIIWNVTIWKPKHQITISEEINDLKFVDGFSLASISANEGLKFWDTESGENRLTYKNINFGIMNSMVINDQRVLFIGTNLGYILVFDRFGEKKDDFRASGPVISLHKMLNGDIVTNLNTSIRFFKNSDNSLIRIIPIETGMDTFTVTAPTRGINESLVYSLKSSFLILDPLGDQFKSITNIENNLFNITSQLSTGLLVSANSKDILFFNLATGLLVNSIRNIPAKITSMVANGTNVIIGTDSRLVVIFENTFVENNAELPEPEEPKLITIKIKAHSGQVTTFDTNNDDLIASGSLDGSVVFINRSTTQIMKRFEFSDSIVHVKFDDPFVLVVSSGGNLSKIHSNTFSLEKSVKLTETVTSAQLINNNILIGTETGFIQVYQKDTLEKIEIDDLIVSEKPIDVIANLNGSSFASSSGNELKIWTSNYSLFSGPIDTTSKVMAIFMLSNKNVVTIDQDGFIVIWADKSFNRISDSKISGSNVQVTSAVTANSGNIFIALKNSIIEYDLLNKIEVGVETIGATQISIDRFQRPIIGTENGTVIFRVTEIISPATETTHEEITTQKELTTQKEMTTQLILDTSRQASSLIPSSSFTTVDDASPTITSKQQTTLESELTTFGEQTSTKSSQTSIETNNPTTLTYQSSLLSSLLEKTTETITESEI
ncbi:hypothetical protein BpHYR1_038224 [Brachionus plicatilis]|uniref:Uncharacterized protein n=1 Tax=Brachionus plicatilis TaxID=10195 RepID=A0A3M7SJA2_BRAPC|nr:hypothetical protein BpHYR1_038224 [Brachionus plicatilis]